MTTIGIDVEANTGAAKRAFDDLSAAIRETTTASDGAGESQKTLAQKIAGAKEQQLAATEAVQRAQRALAEHNATVQAHGKDSKEAADSLARLKAAQAEAARQAAVAEKAIADVATETAKAVREADKLTPALARAAREVKATGAQAERAASDVRKLDLSITAMGKSAQQAGSDLKEAKSGLEAFESKLEGINKAVGRATSVLALGGLVSLAGDAAAALGEMADRAQQVSGVNQALRISIDGARASTRGMVSDFTLASTANKAVQLGVVRTSDDFARLTETAAKLGLAMGQDVAQSVEDLTTGIGRQSFEILDNLGIMIKAEEAYDIYAQRIGKAASELSDAEKKQAFMTVALERAEEAAARSNVTLDTHASRVIRVRTEWENFKDDVSTGTTDVLGSYLEWTDAQNQAAEASKRQWELERAGATDYVRFQDTEMGRSYERMTELARSYAAAVGEAITPTLNVYKAEQQRAGAQDELWEALERRLAKQQEAAELDQFFKANEMGPALPPGFHDKKRGKAKEKSSFLDPGDVTVARSHLGGVAESEGLADQAELRRGTEAYAEESAARQGRIDDLSGEIEALEARNAADAETVEVLGFTLEIESQAARTRESLLDQRLAAEEKLARWQAKNALTYAERERAQTRLEQVEHQKRLAGLRRAAADEEKTLRRREQVVGAVTGAVSQLGDALVNGLERAAVGEKGAIASMLEDMLTGVAKKHAILALAEAALAVGSAASFNFGGAALHGQAAAMHTAVAVAAGVGAYAAGQVADSRAGGGSRSTSSGSSATGSGGRSGSRSDDGDLEAQEVPVSHEQLRRSDASAKGGAGAGVVVNINNPTIAGAGGVKQLAETIQREIERNTRGGKRPRN